MDRGICSLELVAQRALGSIRDIEFALGVGEPVGEASDLGRVPLRVGTQGEKGVTQRFAVNCIALETCQSVAVTKIRSPSDQEGAIRRVAVSGR